jgi:hypothetical protein
MGKYINKNSNGTGLGSSASDKINRLVEDGATSVGGMKSSVCCR